MRGAEATNRGTPVELCDLDHDEIVFDRKLLTCPLCDALETIEQEEETKEGLLQKIVELREELEELREGETS